MKTLKETPYLVFFALDEEEKTKKQPKKTKLIGIVNKHHEEVIGEIRWFSRWRQYCFYPYPNTIWNITCLTDVNSVIKDLMDERKPHT